MLSNRIKITLVPTSGLFKVINFLKELYNTTPQKMEIVFLTQYNDVYCLVG